jgi:tetratricopeptide (TPR) repeat protein
MKRIAFLLIVLTGLARVSAQTAAMKFGTIEMKNGTIQSAEGLERQGDQVMVRVNTLNAGFGQVGVPVSDIARLNLPEPKDIKSASALNSDGKFDMAFAQIDPIATYQKTIRDIPGNWWGKAAVVEIKALLGLNRTADATALENDIATYSKDPEILLGAKLEVALSTKFTDPQVALAAYDDIINQSRDPLTLSQAWIAEADIHFGQHEFVDALMNYLTVTVFYPEHNPFIPKAMLGAAESYNKLKDLTNALKTWHQLVDSYPDSPEASLAKAELQKKEPKT